MGTMPIRKVVSGVSQIVPGRVGPAPVDGWVPRTVYATEPTAHLAILLGTWPAVTSAGDDRTIGPFAVDTCLPVPGKVKAIIARSRSPWLLFGLGVDETVLTQIWRSAATMRPSARLAMVGAPDDMQRCDRWLRRGCSVYVSNSVPRRDLQEILTVAAVLDVAIIARDFVIARRVGSFVSLSGRESDVLGLLCEGLRNSEIAGALSLTENTIEFHVSRLLLTLGARNRVQAAAFGIQKGLV